MIKRSQHIVALLLLTVIQSCFKPNDYNNIDANRYIQFLTSDQSLIADGADTAVIKVKLENAAYEKRKVIFKSSIGSFVGGDGDSVTVEADPATLIATAKLISTKAGSTVVSAKVQNLAATHSPVISFGKAFPEKISVSVDSFRIRPVFESVVVITASLSKNNGGKPSAGTIVTYSVTDAGGQNIGYYINNNNTATTGLDGKSTIKFTAGTTTANGRLTISASAVKADGATISGTTQIILSN